MIGPRFVIAVLALFTNYLQTAYTGLLIPLLGFLFMPFTNGNILVFEGYFRKTTGFNIRSYN